MIDHTQQSEGWGRDWSHTLVRRCDCSLLTRPAASLDGPAHRWRASGAHLERGNGVAGL